MLNIAEIKTRLGGIGLTGEFIVNVLKIEPTERDKRAMLFTEDQYQAICDGLSAHALKARSFDPLFG